MKKGFLVLSALALLACSACTIKVIPIIPGGNSQPSSEQTSENPQGGSQEGGSQQGETSQGGTSQGGNSQGGTSQGGGSQTQGETFVINKANCGIDNTEGLEAAKQVEYTVGSGKMKLEWSSGCFQYNKYDEVAIPKGGYLKVISLPAGKKVGTIKMDMYISQSMTVHASADGSGAAITGIDGAATSNKDSFVKSFVINNEKFYLGVDSSSQYAQTFYTLEINLINTGDTPTVDSQGGNESQGGQTESTSQGGTSQTSEPGSGNIAGAHASATGEVPAGAHSLELDFSGGSFGDMPTSGYKNTGTATKDAKEYNYVLATAHPASNYVTTGYLVLYSKGGSKTADQNKAVASFGNKTAINNIVCVTIIMATEKSSGSVSNRAPLIVDFGTETMGSTTLTGGQTGGSGVTLKAYVASGYSASHFTISCVQGMSAGTASTSPSPSWYNASIEKIIVEYTD